MKIAIIGAVAAGTSAAAKARRNDETAEIKIFEMGEEISYSSCGLPYYIGNEIQNREQLVPRDVKFFKSKYNVDILIRHKVLSVDVNAKELKVENLSSGKVFIEKYDKLVISTGATPIFPRIEGIDKENVFVLRNVISADKIKNYIDENKPKKALVVGSGFIGLEMAENLKNIGIDVTVVEMEDHLMKPLDKDVSLYLKDTLLKHEVNVILNDGVVKFEGDSVVTKAFLKSGKAIETDMVIVATGVRPNVELAKNAGVEIGETGAIKVNTKMQTNIEDIYACGDCAESYSIVTGKNFYRPLGSTANKMGRITGDQITGGDLEFRGILGTGIFKIFDMAVAQTGLTEIEAINEGYDISVSHNIKPDKPPYDHGEELRIKAVADRKTEKLLGVQIVGKAGVDKRIDVFVTAITFGAKVSDLFHLDLAYAPPFSTTKDPVMYTGMVLTNDINTNRKLITPSKLQEKIDNKEEIIIIDTREPKQYEVSHVDGAINIPHKELREKANSLDKEKLTVTYCNKGVTGNATQNILLNMGFKNVYNLSGGNKNYSKTLKK